MPCSALRRGRVVLFVTTILVALLLSGNVWASPTRILVAVGHGTGHEDERPLRYAEQDAVKVVGAFTSLGGVATDQVILLRKPTASQLRSAMGQAQARASKHARSDVSFVFYFSGHGDRTSLHLGNESLPIAELTRLVQAVPASLRLVVLDACRSNRAKGMSAEQGFAISLGNPSGTTGTAWLFASADGEAAQESDPLGGAVFTHAWVTGLRGAADADGDRRVSLAESYAYAYHETLYRSARGSGVLQRPSAKFEVSEVAPITLTSLGGQTGHLIFPKEADVYYLVYAPRSRTVTAELWSSPDRPVTLSLPPGRYVLHRRASGKGAAAELAVASGEERAVASSDFREVPLQALASKGGALVLRPWEVEAGYGVHTARTQQLGHRILLRSAYSLGEFALSLAVEAGAGRDTTVANEVTERWVGIEPAAELRWSLGEPTLRLGIGPSWQFIEQTVRRDDAERVERAGYSAEREYSGSALGAHALAGLRLGLIGPTWTELGVSGSWHAARAEGQLVSRWRGGGALSVGASF